MVKKYSIAFLDADALIKLWNVNHKLLTTINVFIKLEYKYYCIKDSILSATIYCQFNVLSKVDKLTNLKFSNSTIYIFTFSKKDYIYIYLILLFNLFMILHSQLTVLYTFNFVFFLPSMIFSYCRLFIRFFFFFLSVVS